MIRGLNRRAGLLAVLLVSACATGPNNIYGGAFGQKVTGNEVSVTVSNVWNQADALPLADRHCRQFAKAARFHSMEGNAASFDCITP